MSERSGDNQGRRDGRREQGEPHGSVAAPAALPRLLCPKRGSERHVATRIRGHRQHQGPAGGHLQADRLLRRHPRRRRPGLRRRLGRAVMATLGLGRRDSLTANENEANTALPAPSSNINNLTDAFGPKGFTLTDIVALSGAHTIGQAQCQNFRDRLYNETNINSGFATSLKANCPQPTGQPGDSNLAQLDTTTPTS